MLQRPELEEIERRHLQIAGKLRRILVSLQVPSILTAIQQNLKTYDKKTRFEESVFPKHGYSPVTKKGYHELEGFIPLPPDIAIGYYMCLRTGLKIKTPETDSFRLIRRIGVWAVLRKPLSKPDTVTIKAGELHSRPIFSDIYNQSELNGHIVKIEQALRNCRPFAQTR